MQLLRQVALPPAMWLTCIMPGSAIRMPWKTLERSLRLKV